MRILMAGAGGIGGYFGGRLAAVGRDVTFLVRTNRAEILRSNGLSIRSPLGDVHVAQLQLVTADQIDQPFDLIVLSCKAYDLADAIESFAPAIGQNTVILPLLNGMAHLALWRIGSERPWFSVGHASFLGTMDQLVLRFFVIPR